MVSFSISLDLRVDWQALKPSFFAGRHALTVGCLGSVNGVCFAYEEALCLAAWASDAMPLLRPSPDNE
jgi:hypothetical protein